MISRKFVVWSVVAAFSAAQASQNPAIADMANDLADGAAKVFSAVSLSTSAGPYDGAALVTANQVTGVEIRAPVFARVRIDQVDTRPLYVNSTIFDLE